MAQLTYNSFNAALIVKTDFDDSILLKYFEYFFTNKIFGTLHVLTYCDKTIGKTASMSELKSGECISFLNYLPVNWTKQITEDSSNGRIQIKVYNNTTKTEPAVTTIYSYANPAIFLNTIRTLSIHIFIDTCETFTETPSSTEYTYLNPISILTCADASGYTAMFTVNDRVAQNVLLSYNNERTTLSRYQLKNISDVYDGYGLFIYIDDSNIGHFFTELHHTYIYDTTRGKYKHTYSLTDSVNTTSIVIYADESTNPPVIFGTIPKLNDDYYGLDSTSVTSLQYLTNNNYYINIDTLEISFSSYFSKYDGDEYNSEDIFAFTNKMFYKNWYGVNENSFLINKLMNFNSAGKWYHCNNAAASTNHRPTDYTFTNYDFNEDTDMETVEIDISEESSPYDWTSPNYDWATFNGNFNKVDPLKINYKVFNSGEENFGKAVFYRNKKARLLFELIDKQHSFQFLGLKYTASAGSSTTATRYNKLIFSAQDTIQWKYTDVYGLEDQTVTIIEQDTSTSIWPGCTITANYTYGNQIIIIYTHLYPAGIYLNASNNRSHTFEDGDYLTDIGFDSDNQSTTLSGTLTIIKS